MTEEQKAPYLIEAARSGRSRCKSCRKTIAKDALRIGILVEGVYGPGYMWHHLTCAARRRPDQLEEAYRLQAWENAATPPKRVPALEKLLAQASRKPKPREKRELPYAEIAPTGRSSCKRCGEAIAEGSLRVVVGREVSFGQQIRTAEVKVHPSCLAAELDSDECATPREGFAEALTRNSKLEEPRLGEALASIGSIEG